LLEYYRYYSNGFRIISSLLYGFTIYVNQRPTAFENGNTTTTIMAPQHATITVQNVCVTQKVMANGRQEIPSNG